jgi:hypothetical protein
MILLSTPDRKWEFHFTTLSTGKVDSARETRHFFGELELFAAGIIKIVLQNCSKELLDAKRGV